MSFGRAQLGTNPGHPGGVGSELGRSVEGRLDGLRCSCNARSQMMGRERQVPFVLAERAR